MCFRNIQGCCTTSRFKKKSNDSSNVEGIFVILITNRFLLFRNRKLLIFVPELSQTNTYCLHYTKTPITESIKLADYIYKFQGNADKVCHILYPSQKQSNQTYHNKRIKRTTSNVIAIINYPFSYQKYYHLLKSIS